MASFPLKCVINRNNLPRLHFLTYSAAACIKAYRGDVLNRGIVRVCVFRLCVKGGAVSYRVGISVCVWRRCIVRLA